MSGLSGELERIPPHSMEAEQATLGAMLLERDAIARVVDSLRPEDFYQEAHRLIYDGITSLFNEGQPVDPITLGERLTARGQFERIGGDPYLAAVQGATPTAANVELYARIVREKAVLRGLISAAHEILRMAYDVGDKDVEEVVDYCEQAIFAVSERSLGSPFSSLRDLLPGVFDNIEDMAHAHQPGTGVLSGYEKLDVLTGGFQPSDLVILAARPSMGKTALALNVATHAALTQGHTVAVFSLEMAKDQLALRVLCSEARVDQHAVRQGYVTPEGLERITKAADVLYKAPIYIDDSPVLSVLEMRGKARRLRAEHGLDLIVVDYLQLVRGYGRYENRNQEISQVARSLKAIARELRVPVLALSQLSRAVESRQPRRPVLSDLRESGSIEQEADVVTLIYRPGYYDDPEEMRRAGYTGDERHLTELIVAKHRNGPTGTVRLAWTNEHVRFDQLEEYRVPDGE